MPTPKTSTDLFLQGSSTKGDPEAGPDIDNYKETTIQRYARYLVMILASLLPVVCIVVLHAVNSVGWRLGATAFFTAGFAAALVIFTSAKEVEVFASTAALVVLPLTRFRTYCLHDPDLLPWK